MCAISAQLLLMSGGGLSRTSVVSGGGPSSNGGTSTITNRHCNTRPRTICLPNVFSTDRAQVGGNCNNAIILLLYCICHRTFVGDIIYNYNFFFFFCWYIIVINESLRRSTRIIPFNLVQSVYSRALQVYTQEISARSFYIRSLAIRYGRHSCITHSINDKRCFIRKIF